MKALDKSTLLCMAFSLIASTSIANSYAFAQDQDKEIKVKHKVFQIKKSNDKPTKIEIEENGEIQIIEVNMDELNDDALLESKLSNLEEDTRATVLKVLKQGEKKFSNGFAFIENDSSVTLDNIEFDADFTGKTEIIVVNDGENVDFKGVLKGHQQAIIKLIERGDFTRDELNEIQKALDAKY